MVNVFIYLTYEKCFRWTLFYFFNLDYPLQIHVDQQQHYNCTSILKKTIANGST